MTFVFFLYIYMYFFMYRSNTTYKITDLSSTKQREGATVTSVFTGLKIGDQLVAHATRFLIVRQKSHVWSHLRT